MDNTVGFVSRNLVTEMNFIKFRDGRIFHEFRGKKEPKWVGDTWHDACMPCACMPYRFVQSIKMDRWRKREERKKKEKKGRGKEREEGGSDSLNSGIPTVGVRQTQS